MAKNKKYKSEWSRGEGPALWVPVIIVLAIIVAAIYFFWPYGDPLPETATEEPVPAEEQPVIDKEPQGPRYPVPETLEEPEPPEPEVEQPQAGEEQAEPEPEPEPPAEPLPSLDQSDEPLQQSLQEFIAQNRFEELFIPESLIRHFVVTIDNMTRAKLPEKFDFTQPVPDSFKVEEIDDDDRYRLDPANYERYRRYVVFAEAVNLDRVVSVYVRYYPLFQEAYEELGYPDRYFNDRFVEVIDHLLAAPDVEQPIELVRPKVFYKFADPRLEDLSAGHKLMIRIGPDNAARIKSVLRSLRAQLTGTGVGQD